MDVDQPTSLANQSVRITAAGLVVEGNSPLHRFIGFIDTILRGIGQVMLQNNSFAGLIFLIGIFYNSALFGMAVLIGTAASTTTAILLTVDRTQIRQGLFGFNGALVAIALLYFLEPNLLTWGYVVIACSFSTVFMAALLNLFNVWKLPTLTAPFILTTLCFVLACARFGRLHSTSLLPTAGLPQAASVEGVVTATTVVEGLFNGIAQVFFQGNVITGVFFAIGLLISSRLAFVTALVGSLTGVFVAWGMGAAEPAIRSGAFGFNCVLTAIAIGSVFFILDTVSAIYGLLAVITTAVTFAAISAALQPIGMPAMTAPFVIVVWLFVLASPTFPRLRRP
ncbi:MAG: urea transporter [Aquirhabdus sp.]